MNKTRLRNLSVSRLDGSEDFYMDLNFSPTERKRTEDNCDKPQRWQTARIPGAHVFDGEFRFLCIGMDSLRDAVLEQLNMYTYEHCRWRMRLYQSIEAGREFLGYGEIGTCVTP